MKILFILELYYPNIGGIEKLFKTLTERLVEEGHDVTVITTRFRKGLPARENMNGVHIKRLRISSRFMFTFLGVFGMLKEARQADIIHTTSYNAAFPARIAGWITRRKVIITFHEAWGKLWFKLPYTGIISKTLFFVYEQMILRLGFHRYIAVSDYTAKRLEQSGVRKDKIIRIYNGIEYSKYEPSRYHAPDEFTFTYFGRLGISKGLDIIMEAVPEFLNSHPDIHLKLIVPKTPPSFLRRVLKFMDSLPKERHTILHNLEEQQLYDELQNSSCVLIPSYSEGFCFAAAESIALGVPVISSGEAALKEVISGKYITMESLSKEGLLQAMELAFQGQWNETGIKEFHFEETVKNYILLYTL